MASFAVDTTGQLVNHPAVARLQTLARVLAANGAPCCAPIGDDLRALVLAVTSVKRADRRGAALGPRLACSIGTGTVC